MTPEEEEANAARPLRLRKFTSEQAGDAIQRGDCEVMALYIRQLLREGQSDYRFMTWLANLLDPQSNERDGLVMQQRGRGRLTDELGKTVKAIQIAMMVRDDIAAHPGELLKASYGRVAKEQGVSDKTVSDAYVEHRDNLEWYAKRTGGEK